MYIDMIYIIQHIYLCNKNSHGPPAYEEENPEAAGPARIVGRTQRCGVSLEMLLQRVIFMGRIVDLNSKNLELNQIFFHKNRNFNMNNSDRARKNGI
jgi:hypothetical protein